MLTECSAICVITTSVSQLKKWTEILNITWKGYERKLAFKLIFYNTLQNIQYYTIREKKLYWSNPTDPKF